MREIHLPVFLVLAAFTVFACVEVRIAEPASLERDAAILVLGIVIPGWLIFFFDLFKVRIEQK